MSASKRTALKESKWRIIYTDPQDRALRVETRLCEAHSDEFLPTLKRPWILVSLKTP